MCSKLYSNIEIIGDHKNGEYRIFVRIIGANKGRLVVFLGALRFPIFLKHVCVLEIDFQQ